MDKNSKLIHGSSEDGAPRACGGDSGGPLFESIKDQLSLIGIYSSNTGANSCEDDGDGKQKVATWTDVTQFKDVIDCFKGNNKSVNPQCKDILAADYIKIYPLQENSLQQKNLLGD